eukprot:757951-Hanusia_phi.AAC.1
MMKPAIIIQVSSFFLGLFLTITVMLNEGPTQTALRNQNHLDRIIFHCCGGEQVGFSPVLYECPPCKVGRHISAEEKEAQQKAGAKKELGCHCRVQRHCGFKSGLQCVIHLVSYEKSWVYALGLCVQKI